MDIAFPQLLKVLAEPTRLRILALLDREELSVGELARALAMLQSRISNHLKMLREAGLLDERREGAFVLVRLASGDALRDELWAAIRPRIAELEQHADDLARLTEVIEDRRKRSRDYFDRVAADWDVMGSDFQHGTTRYQALARLVPSNLVVADVGCGTGYMARALVRQVDRVICVDHSEAMLNQARASLKGQAGRVEFRQGELDDLPLRDGEVNAVFAHMVMHHVPDLIASLNEMYRAIQPGGWLVISDLCPHRESWMTEEMADLRLGLDPTDLARRARRAGFTEVETEVPNDAHVVTSPDGKRHELELFLLSGRRPSTNGTPGQKDTEQDP